MLEGIVAVIARDGRVLVIRRAQGIPFAGYWAPLSGRLEPGESQAQALVREVHEEVGLVVRAGRKIWECPSSDGLYRLHWWLAQLDDASREVVPDPREVSAYAWVEPAEFARLEPVFEADAVFFREIYPTLAER
ncbi:MAG: NUDIX domain-containing protein [Myxococcota bacterium]